MTPCDARVVDRLDDDVVAEPVDADLADLLRPSAGLAGADRRAEHEGAKQMPHENLLCQDVAWRNVRRSIGFGTPPLQAETACSGKMPPRNPFVAGAAAR